MGGGTPFLYNRVTKNARKSLIVSVIETGLNQFSLTVTLDDTLEESKDSHWDTITLIIIFLALYCVFLHSMCKKEDNIEVSIYLVQNLGLLS